METKYYQVSFIYEDYSSKMIPFTSLDYATLTFRECLPYVRRAYIYEVTVSKFGNAKLNQICSYEKSASL